MRLEDLTKGATVKGILPDRVITVDVIVCDEAHKMSASFYGGERRETKRYKLGKLLSGESRDTDTVGAQTPNPKPQTPNPKPQTPNP